jgi:hypothetical protein
MDLVKLSSRGLGAEMKAEGPDAGVEPQRSQSELTGRQVGEMRGKNTGRLGGTLEG